MKTPKLIRKAKEYLNPEKAKEKHQVKSIKELLKKLKKKQQSLKDKLDKENDRKEKRRIETEINILKAQRSKGLKLLKKIKKR